MKPKIYKLEKTLKTDVKKVLDEVRAQWIMIVPHGYGKNAVDFLINYRGRFISLETKVGNNKPTTQQWDWLIDTIKHYGISLVAYDLIPVYEVLRYVDDGLYYECPHVTAEVRRRKDLGIL